jgi:hypothetical protein
VYVLTAVFPFPTRFDWWLEVAHPNPWTAVNVACLLLLLTLSAFGVSRLIRALRTGGRLGTFPLVILFGAVTLVPVAHLLPLNIIVADRFFYFTLPILLGGLALVVAFALRRLPPVVVRALGGMVVLLALVRTEIELSRWRDNETLWSSVLEHSPENHRALYGLGRSLMKQNRMTDAVPLLEDSWRRFRHPSVAALLGRAYESLGRAREALSAYRAYVVLATTGAPEDNTQNRDFVLARVRELEARLFPETRR